MAFDFWLFNDMKASVLAMKNTKMKFLERGQPGPRQYREKKKNESTGLITYRRVVHRPSDEYLVGFSTFSLGIRHGSYSYCTRL